MRLHVREPLASYPVPCLVDKHGGWRRIRLPRLKQRDAYANATRAHCLGASLFTLSSAASQSNRFPVSWCAVLRLDNRDHIEARLREPEPKLVDQPVEMVHWPGSGGEKRLVSNCTDYFKALRDRFAVETTLVRNFESYLIETCFVLEDLRHAKASVVSYVPHEWSPEAIAFVPPLVQIGDLRGTVNLEAPWIDIADAKVTDVRNDGFTVQDTSHIYWVQNLARGDFNHNRRTATDECRAGENMSYPLIGD